LTVRNCRSITTLVNGDVHHFGKGRGAIRKGPNMSHVDTIRDHAAIEGFILYLTLQGGGNDLDVYVRPDTDLDGRFKAICALTGEALAVNGWLYSVDSFEYLAA